MNLSPFNLFEPGLSNVVILLVPLRQEPLFDLLSHYCPYEQHPVSTLSAFSTPYVAQFYRETVKYS